MSGNSVKSKRPCSLSSFIPLGMSCRDRAEAFARSLQSRLRTLGSQSNQSPPPELQLTNNNNSTNAITENSWLLQQPPQTNETNAQIDKSISICGPIETESFYDFEQENGGSPGSPAEEIYYTEPKISTSEIAERYISSSPTSSGSSVESRASSDGPYFDLDNSEELKTISLSVDYFDCVDLKRDFSDLQNGHTYPVLVDSDSCSESLPNSQSTTTSLSTGTAISSSSNNTLQDEAILELCLLSKEQYEADEKLASGKILMNGHHFDDEPLDDIEKFTNDKILKLPHIIDSTPEASPEPESEQNCENEGNVEHLSIIQKTEDEDNFDDRPQRVRRCSSLKTGKTPPGTPGRKKFVRFADVLGLDLADVKTFMDEIPTIPKSAYEDLVISDSHDEVDNNVFIEPVYDKILVPLFDQPGGMPGFLDLVREQQVCLENAAVTDPICLTITGNVRVRNLDFNKSVHLRYTLDSWRSFADFQANYIENSCDGFSDKFAFTVFGNSLQIGQKIEMAVRFSCKGEQFWDNNNGANYCFQCLPASAIQNLPPDQQLRDCLTSASMQSSAGGSNLWSEGTFY